MRNKIKSITQMISLSFIICTLSFSVALTSCLDTIILPEDKTVDEDFWKTKNDVSAMVNAAYAGMTSEDVISKLIVWGGFRSDEMMRSTSLTGSIPDALEEMAAVNMQVTNSFASWASIYSVINRCNIVLERAADVMLEDPSYTESDYESDCCQMLALRSLCYFYLVRNFRDVPYVTEAYMNSSQNTQVAQSSPQYVIDQIIETLEGIVANPNCLRSNSYTTAEWRRVGWMTRDGVMALLADVCLWRASVMHSSSDYQKCADYCQQIIESKRIQHVKGRNELEEKAYPIAEGTDAYGEIFAAQNAEESIFELQSVSNSGLCKYLFKYANNNSGEGYLKASNIFGTSAGAPNQIGVSTVFAAQDLRFYAATFSGSGNAEVFDIRKMISTSSMRGKNREARSSDRPYDNFAQNYIVYRLTDVMLMRAEAITQLLQDTGTEEGATASDEVTAFNDSLKQEIFNLVEAVNTRSIDESDRASYSMQWNTYKDYAKNQWETYILQERLRELCFEGKRWYDLLRYNYRHVNGVQYDQILGALAADATASNSQLALPAIYDDMLALATRSRGTDAPAIRAKMQNEAYLYLPIPNSDINVCPLLIQNPAYKSGSTYEKSY